MYYPRQPVVNFCNKQIDWTHLIMNIETIVTDQVYADFEFLLSVYNPNRAHVQIAEIEGSLFYPAGSSQVIGRIQVANFDIPGGSVSDAISVVKLSMPKYLALEIATKYFASQLLVS